MANITVRFYSKCLNRCTTFQMFLPYDPRDDAPADVSANRPERTKTLFLLHGYTGDAWNWVPEQLAEKYNFAIIMPNGENSFWIDGISTGHRFGTFIGEELPKFLRKTFHLAMNRDETYVMGFSMGGFGAIHSSLRYPDVFGKAAALSSALIVHRLADTTEWTGNAVANFEYYRECFGDPDKVLDSDKNPETLVKKIKAEGKTFPEIYMSCGTEDFLIESNRQFHHFLTEQGVEHVYLEDAGGHDFDFWNKCVEKFIPAMFG